MKRRSNGKATSIPVGLAWGVGVSLLLTALLSMVVAWMIENGFLDYEKMGYSVIGILLFSSFVGAGYAHYKIKHRKLMVCLACGAGYFFSLLIITALFFGGRYTAIIETGLMVLCGSVLYSLFSVSGKSKKGIKYQYTHL